MVYHASGCLPKLMLMHHVAIMYRPYDWVLSRCLLNICQRTHPPDLPPSILLQSNEQEELVTKASSENKGIQAKQGLHLEASLGASHPIFSSNSWWGRASRESMRALMTSGWSASGACTASGAGTASARLVVGKGLDNRCACRAIQSQLRIFVATACDHAQQFPTGKSLRVSSTSSQVWQSHSSAANLSDVSRKQAP